MDVQLLLALMIVAMISCLQLTPVSGLSLAVREPTRELDVTETDSNTTNWTVILPNPQRQKRALGCKHYRRAQIIRRLNKLGAKSGISYGSFNRRYMAFTWQEARKFPSLVPTVGTTPPNVSSIRFLLLRAPKIAGSIMSSSNCVKSDGGLQRMCGACPTVTFLGHDKIPSYINEVTCGQTACSFGMAGICQNAVMYQEFLQKTGRCDSITGYEELLPYTQEIRVCCECMVFNS